MAERKPLKNGQRRMSDEGPGRIERIWTDAVKFRHADRSVSIYDRATVAAFPVIDTASEYTLGR